MFELQLHKHAIKALQKAPKKIRERAYECILYLKKSGTKNCPFQIVKMQGQFKKFEYFEAKIDKDYRIIFRIDKKTLYIRDAGTHNKLGTG